MEIQFILWGWKWIQVIASQCKMTQSLKKRPNHWDSLSQIRHGMLLRANKWLLAVGRSAGPTWNFSAVICVCPDPLSLQLMVSSVVRERICKGVDLIGKLRFGICLCKGSWLLLRYQSSWWLHFIWNVWRWTRRQKCSSSFTESLKEAWSVSAIMDHSDILAHSFQRREFWTVFLGCTVTWVEAKACPKRGLRANSGSQPKFLLALQQVAKSNLVFSVT